jgi:hypothetical protein
MQSSSIFNLLSKQETFPETSSGPSPFNLSPPVLPPSINHDGAQKSHPFASHLIHQSYGPTQSSKKKSSVSGGAGSLIKTPDFCFTSVHNFALH